MDKIKFRFPSEPTETGPGVRSGGILQAGNIGARPPSINPAFYPTPPESGKIPWDSLYARRGQQPNYNSPTLNPYRPSPQKDVPKSVRVGSSIYAFVRMIEPPTAIKAAMSDGVRVLKDSSGMLVVEKRLKMADKSSRDRAGAEVRALEQIKSAGGSPYINRMVEALYSKGDSHSSLILEYCDQGSLKDVIDSSRRRGELISEQFCWHVLLQLSHALALCHNGISNPLYPNNRPREWNTLCHIDIKPANIFLSGQKAPGFEHVQWPTAVLGDFGCVVTKQDVDNGKVSCHSMPFGTEGWFPPEANGDEWGSGRSGVYGRQTDIWQLGGLILVMCHRLDYPAMQLVALDLPCGSKYCTSLNRAVQKCMARKPSLRPTAIDVARGVSGEMGREQT